MITHGSVRVRYQNDIKLFEIFTVRDEMKKSFELDMSLASSCFEWKQSLNFYVLNFFFLSGDPQNIIM